MNHNDNDNALKLMAALSAKFENVWIVDAGSDQVEESFISAGKTFYSGMLNKSSELFLSTQSTGCLYVTSDVQIEQIDELANALNSIPSSVGIWTPAVSGKSHYFLKNKGTGQVREVPFAEGMIFYASRKVIESIYPIIDNVYGWGIDVYLGYLSRVKLGLSNLLDESIEVYHPPGTRYSWQEAEIEMKVYNESKGQEFVDYFKSALLYVG